jgi:hypothetical protein
MLNKMNKMEKHSNLLVIVSAIIGVMIITGFILQTYYNNILFPQNNNHIDTVSITVRNMRKLECELIRADIETFGDQIGLSSRQQREYITYIDSAARRYMLPPMLIHAIIYVESAYDPNARHSQIVVKNKPTYAIGLTGVVWEYHSDSLIREGIAMSRLELTEPRINIMASAYILHNYIVSIMRNKPNLPENQLFDELIRKYYGAYDNNYKERMLIRIRDTASRQWIRRVTQEIFLKFKNK